MIALFSIAGSPPDAGTDVVDVSVQFPGAQGSGVDGPPGPMRVEGVTGTELEQRALPACLCTCDPAHRDAEAAEQLRRTQPPPP